MVTPTATTERPRLVVAGASGFIGRHLGERLKRDFHLIGLTRALGASEPPDAVYHEWRQCDLFSLLDTENALRHGQIGVYLVHSMLPSARLTQAKFHDLDLICADNFARAAAKHGYQHIVYLSGIIPKDEKLSDHLRSRLEVEETLQSYGVPVTTLRAGLILGARGSSFRMLYRLVDRLPVLVLPRWTQTPTQPVGLKDVLGHLEQALLTPPKSHETFDIANPEATTYETMLRSTAQMLGKKRYFIHVPWFSPALSRFWVSLVTGYPKSLVAPLVQSLRHRMIARGQRPSAYQHMPQQPWQSALQEALPAETQNSGGASGEAPHPDHKTKPTNAIKAPKKASPHTSLRAKLLQQKKVLKTEKRVRSVQRLPLPSGRSAYWVAEEYMRWLPQFLRPFLKVRIEDERRCYFDVPFLGITLLLLEFSKERSTPDRPLLYIRGGILARNDGDRGRLEFREVLDHRYVLAAIHDFPPRLPWYIYNLTQALVHLTVMRRFGRHLSRLNTAQPDKTDASDRDTQLLR